MNMINIEEIALCTTVETICTKIVKIVVEAKRLE